MTSFMPTRQITSAAHGHIIANRNVWTADSRSILYDVRDDETVFSGNRIERVEVDSGRVEVLYESAHEAKCGVPTCSPIDDRYVFIHGPEHPTNDWGYCAWHRRGAIGRLSEPNRIANLDAQDFLPPFTPGALRGGTHLHMFSPDGRMVASTYEDHVLATDHSGKAQSNRRVIALTLLDREVQVSDAHPRNVSGAFTFVLTPVEESPDPGSDAMLRAYSEAWIDNQRIAFLGDVVGQNGVHAELFLLTLPSPLMISPGPQLQGTELTRPDIPEGILIKRLTFTADRPFPGIRGPRHWAVASPMGDWIGCFQYDASGIAQFFVVDASSGESHQVTAHEHSATSSFTWSPDGKCVAFAADRSIFRVDVSTGLTERLTPRAADPSAPTHHACVYSPNGQQITYLARVACDDGDNTQIFCVDLTS
jgi:hypothetical protein